mmetsp:Transcript_46317/g.134203  ORF Transcript_46317/g.134203 Transcript_46317/m.134203 type:complete len:222 (-) Transcript_46317:173-838(-)
MWTRKQMPQRMGIGVQSRPTTPRTSITVCSASPQSTDGIVASAEVPLGFEMHCMDMRQAMVTGRYAAMIMVPKEFMMLSSFGLLLVASTSTPKTAARRAQRAMIRKTVKKYFTMGESLVITHCNLTMSTLSCKIFRPFSRLWNGRGQGIRKLFSDAMTCTSTKVCPARMTTVSSVRSICLVAFVEVKKRTDIAAMRARMLRSVGNTPVPPHSSQAPSDTGK